MIFSSVGPEKSSEEDEDEQNNIAQNGAETSNLRWFFRNIKGLFLVAVYFLFRSITGKYNFNFGTITKH